MSLRSFVEPVQAALDVLFAGLEKRIVAVDARIEDRDPNGWLGK
jgi:hypothetical protein